MSASYIVLLTAFYADNAKNLPLWRDLPHLTWWLGPGAVGIPLVVGALVRHRGLRHLARTSPDPPQHGTQQPQR